mgnify:CR=1 FL=1
MKFLDKENYSKIKELANSGDEKAKDFLFNFMSMSDEETNEYLSTLAENEPKESDFNEVIKKLIEDENEAIDGYDKAIKYITNTTNDETVINKLQKIKDDEIQHIEDLNELIKGWLYDNTNKIYNTRWL